MNADCYLLLITKNKDFKALREKFHSLGGFFNGFGYAFPIDVENELKAIVSPLNVSLLTMPLAPAHSFEALRLSFKADYYRKILMEKESKLFILKNSLNVDTTIANVEELDIPILQKQDILDLSNECEKLRNAMEWAEGLEKAITSNTNKSFSIKFIKDHSKNFLIEDAPEMPRLVNFIDADGFSKAFIRKGIVGMVVGSGGVGKTHYLTQLALSIATGLPFLETYPIENPGGVFLGLGENSEEDIHRLLRKTFKKSFLPNSQMNFKDKQIIEIISRRLSVSSFTGKPSTFIQQGIPTALFQSFINELKTKEPPEGWACIILDPISRFLGAEAETDNAAATQFIALLEVLTLELKGKPTVLFGHHMNKSGVSNTNTDQAAARGSSAITDGVRWQVNLDKVERSKNSNEDDSKFERDKIKMRVVKSNFTTIPPSQTLFKDDLGCLHLFKEPSSHSTNQKILKSKKPNKSFELLESLGVGGI